MKLKFLTSLFAFALLFTSCSTDSIVDKIKEEIETLESINSYTDVSFSLKDDSERFFAASTGDLYKESNITATNVSLIDLVGVSNTAFIAFASPSRVSTLANGKVTKIQHTNVSLDVASFDDLNVATLSILNVNDDEDSLPIDSKDKIILFENAEGKKGAIKIKAINADRLLVDIKVMK